MLIFQRTIEDKIRENLFKRQIVTILGPRQSGKTTLSKKIVGDFGDSGAYFDCEMANVRKHFVLGEPDHLLKLIGTKKIVVFDEAQTIENIGKILKVFFDTYPDVQIIATGSSSFDLANKIREPLTGRAREFTLLPLSLSEIRSVLPISNELLLNILRFGSYPAVVGSATVESKEGELTKIATNYLYKDIFVFESIKNPRIFEELLKLIAFQVGSTVSTNELAQTLGIHRAMVDKYIRLLEQSFVIKKIYSFSNNRRTELKKAFKIFFVDIGIRNALIDVLSAMDERSDKGAIFENFFVAERMKAGTLQTFPPEIMFWRTRTGLEIDVIEKQGPIVRAYECKWGSEPVSFKIFLKNYPGATVETVTPEAILKKYS